MKSKKELRAKKSPKRRVLHSVESPDLKAFADGIGAAAVKGLNKTKKKSECI
jgi:hypothetical protein